MLIYDALKKDHEKVKALLSQLVACDPDETEKASQLIGEIRDELIPHARAEEAVFYNPLRSIEGTDNLVMHGYAEHAEAEALLRLLQTLETIDVDWRKTAHKLKDALEHHIDEEENEIFPAARQVLIEEEARMMATAFEQMKPEIRDGSFMQTTLDMIVNLMPPRFSVPLRNFIYRP